MTKYDVTLVLEGIEAPNERQATSVAVSIINDAHIEPDMLRARKHVERTPAEEGEKAARMDNIRAEREYKPRSTSGS